MAMPSAQAPLTEVTPLRNHRAQDLDSEFVWQQRLSQNGDINPGQLLFVTSRLQPKAEAVFTEMKMKHLGTSLLGGAGRRWGQMELRMAAPSPRLLAWESHPPKNLHTKLQNDFQSPKRSGGRSLRSARSRAAAPFAGALLQDGEGRPGGHGGEEGATGPSCLALGTGTGTCATLGSTGLPRDPTDLRTLFSGEFPPWLVPEESAGHLFPLKFLKSSLSIGILILYLWYKLWIFPSSLSFVFWACLWWPFSPGKFLFLCSKMYQPFVLLHLDFSHIVRVSPCTPRLSSTPCLFIFVIFRSLVHLEFICVYGLRISFNLFFWMGILLSQKPILWIQFKSLPIALPLCFISWLY